MSDFLLDARDEFPHPADPSIVNFNESVYVNAFDGRQQVGGWMRIGNRVNEGHAEMAVCLYLPGGRVACQFKRPGIDSNERFAVGGLAYDVQQPLRAVRMDYEGPLVVFDDPGVLRNPEAAFANARAVPGSVRFAQTGRSPIHGGVPVSDAVETYYGRDFSFAHFNQHMSVAGHIRVGDEEWKLDCAGWRDHSWGPRYWQNIFFYRLFIANFDDGRALMLLKITDPSRRTRRLGVLLVDGRYEEVIDMDVTTAWNATSEPRAMRIVVRTAERAAAIDAEVLTTAPLRNRRKVDGAIITSRVVEAFTRFDWEGVPGAGIAEYNDRLVDERPVGVPL